MRKKPISLFFLLLAYVLLVGHSIIPHHHHESAKELASHHQSHHHHDHDHGDSEKGLSHPLSHYLHHSDIITFAHSHSTSNTLYHQLPVLELPEYLSIEKFTIPTLLFSPPDKPLFYHSPHTHSSGLRAPPAIFT